jgi:hypothetical protein
MKPTPAAEEREERIHMEIIADAYGPEEQAMGWYFYLQDSLGFPLLTAAGWRRGRGRGDVA